MPPFALRVHGGEAAVLREFAERLLVQGFARARPVFADLETPKSVVKVPSTLGDDCRGSCFLRGSGGNCAAFSRRDF
jgi:hypothetical protein